MKKIMKQVVAVVCMLAMLSAVLTGCGKSGNAGTDQSAGTDNSKTFAENPYSDIPKELKGTEISVALWYEVPDEELKVIEEFTQKTGIKVNVEVVATSDAGYSEKVVAAVSSGMPYDVIKIGETNFPIWTSSVCQPLDETVFRLEDDIWDHELMDGCKVDGKYYGVNIKGSFSNDTSQVLYYNKTMLENYGVKTPRQYYEEGNWNWDTLEETCKAVKDSISGVSPLGFFKTQMMAQSAGTDFVTYDGTKFSANLTDQKLIDAYARLAKFTKLGYHTSDDYFADELSSGKLAMLCGITFGMKSNNGWWAEDGGLRSGELDAVPFPSPVGEELLIPTDVKLFGISKGSKNQEAAAYFLRYFLDPANYDMDNMFLNDNLKDTFNQVLQEKRCINYSEAIIKYIDSHSYYQLDHYLIRGDASQTNVTLDKYSNIVTKAVSRVNDEILGVEE